jgi:hypothetical protein
MKLSDKERYERLAEKQKSLHDEIDRLKGLVKMYRDEEQKSELVLNLKPAEWRPEQDLGEAGIISEWLIVDKFDRVVGKYVEWYGEKCGIFFGVYPEKVTRIEVPKNLVRVQKRTA